MAEQSPASRRQRAQLVRAMFSRIAGVYDLLNRLLSLRQDVRWRRKAIALLQQQTTGPLPVVLDVCGGTGDLGLAALRAGAAGRVVVLDFARPMLARAQAKHPTDETWAVAAADALQLPVPAACADAVVVGFGVRNLVDHDVAAAEFARVLRPGGQLLVLEFMAGQRGVMYRLFRLYFHYVLPVIGRLVSRDREAYSYLPASVQTFVTLPQWQEILARHGLEPGPHRTFFGGVATASLARRPPVECLTR